MAPGDFKFGVEELSSEGAKISHNYFKSIVTSLRLLSLIVTISCTYLSHLWVTTQSRPLLPLTCTTAMSGFFSSLCISYVDAR